MRRSSTVLERGYDGSSAAAIRTGVWLDTSMGFNSGRSDDGTRSGDLDPPIDLDGIETFLNRKRGSLVVSSVSSNTPDL
ncbi:MAG: hypothetical protein ACJ74Y_04000 [Bryobacteraceae bacterium]